MSISLDLGTRKNFKNLKMYMNVSCNDSYDDNCGLHINFPMVSVLEHLYLSLVPHYSLWPSVSTDDLLSYFTKLSRPSDMNSLNLLGMSVFFFFLLIWQVFTGIQGWDRVSGNLAGKIWKKIQQCTEDCTLMDVHTKQGLPRWCSAKEPTCQCKRHRRCGFDPWVRKILWNRK